MTITNSAAKTKSLGIYVHIPFCVRKCAYCDFLSFANRDETVHRSYACQLSTELIGRSAVYGNKYSVDTIFIGGGTPSLLSPILIDAILDTIYARFRVEGDAEVTMEVNPGTVDGVEHFTELRNAGVTRLSIGAQSFQASMLRFLGRVHEAADVTRCYALAREAGFENINLDLMFGMPDERLDTWKADLQTAITLNPEHISFYSLQIEEETPLFGEIMNGKYTPLPEIDDRLMYHHAIEALCRAGYVHYEISNAARPGFASRHNLKYWSLDDYLGVGLGAHSYINGRRFANTNIWKDYMGADEHGALTMWSHENSQRDDIAEYVFLGLRKIEGIDLSRFRRQFGRDFWEIYREETHMLMERGLLEHRDGILRLTRLGLDLSNQVFVEYI